MNGFERRREQKKEQILSALLDLLLTRDMSEIGVREIAAHAGVSPASIYNFFGSKDGLMRQLMDKYMRQMSEGLTALPIEQMSFLDMVSLFEQMSYAKQENIKHEALGNFNFNDSAFFQYMQEYAMKTSYPLLESAADKGVAEGYLSHSVSKRAMAFFAECMWMMLRDPKIQAEMDEQLRQDITHLFLYGVFGVRPQEIAQEKANSKE